MLEGSLPTLKMENVTFLLDTKDYSYTYTTNISKYVFKWSECELDGKCRTNLNLFDQWQKSLEKFELGF